jgi:hypothetical protein
VGNPRISPRHYEEMTDAELVAAAREGDRDAFATLVERHHAALLRACHGSADAAQESVLIAMTSLAALRDDAAGEAHQPLVEPSARGCAGSAATSAAASKPSTRGLTPT